MGAMLGGGGSAARKAAEQSRQIQAIANDRQLAALSAESQRSGASRRNPRGRRLFMSDASTKTNLS